MYRHLHNSILALSATGLVLLAGLITAAPAPHAAQSRAFADAAGAEAAAMHAPTVEAHAAVIRGRGQAFDAGVERSASAAQLLAQTVAISAAIATETALIAAFQPAADAAAAKAAADRRHRHQVRRSRAALALPYFSFAQGLRHNRS